MLYFLLQMMARARRLVRMVHFEVQMLRFTRYFCDGIATAEEQPGFDCTVALCTLCDKFLGLCVDYTAWSGTPTTIDKRIDFKSVIVQRHEIPSLAVRTMLQGRAASRGSEPQSWVQLQRDSVKSDGRT